MKLPVRSCLASWIAVWLMAVPFPSLRAADETAATSYRTERDVLYRADVAGPDADYMRRRCLLDLYHPVGEKGFATIVWFHGGNLEGGERFIPRAMTEQGFAVAAATYRLSPHVKCPVYIEDAAAAVAWVFHHIGEFGGDPDRIFVAGHSAGGYLTSMVGLDKRWLAADGIDANRIAGLFPFSGQCVTHSTIRKERGLSEVLPIIDEFAPLAHGRADAPPLILITGDRDLDIVGRYEENAYLRRVMQAAGHQQTFLYELEGCTHNTMVEPAASVLVTHIRDLLAARSRQVPAAVAP